MDSNQPTSARWAVKLFQHKSFAVVVAIAGAAALAFIVSCATVDRVVMAPPMIPGAKYVGMESCATCHEKEVQNFKLSAHARLHLRDAEDDGVTQLGCEACHGPGSLHVEAGGGKGVAVINPSKDPSACMQCHLEKAAEFRLPHRHPVLEGRMSCTSCHDPHGEDAKLPAGMFVARVNDQCAQCHREQARPRVFEHEALREGCTTCHAVHGSINEKLLVERDNNLCLKCHGEIGATGQVPIGARNHAAFLARGTCYSAGCHTAMHGSDLNPHLRY